MGVLHRAFPNTDDYISETKKITKEIPSVAVSIGIKDSDYILVEKLIKAGSNIIFVDVAHGFNKYALQMCQHIKKFYPTIKVVAGNTINPDMIGMFNDYVDAIKIGIGGGNSCSTATVVGCTKNQFSAIYDLKEISQKYGMPIISDGNIRCPADFTKAIGAGASCAMAGSIFARCPESASETIEIDGIKKKILAGMSSEYVQNKWKGGLKPGTSAEGKLIHLDIGEPVESLLNRYAGALRSAISYAGFDNIQDFQRGCEFILI
jgi:IMP dehydrogenase